MRPIVLREDLPVGPRIDPLGSEKHGHEEDRRRGHSSNQRKARRAHSLRPGAARQRLEHEDN